MKGNKAFCLCSTEWHLLADGTHAGWLRQRGLTDEAECRVGGADHLTPGTLVFIKRRRKMKIGLKNRISKVRYLV